MMQTLLIFFCFFSCATLLYLLLPFTSHFYFIESAAETERNSNQSKISYQSDTDSLLNILQLIRQSKLSYQLKLTTKML
jgi:hypothetical protein